jgi:hypothetical protein
MRRTVLNLLNYIFANTGHIKQAITTGDDKQSQKKSSFQSQKSTVI